MMPARKVVTNRADLGLEVERGEGGVLQGEERRHHEQAAGDAMPPVAPVRARRIMTDAAVIEPAVRARVRALVTPAG